MIQSTLVERATFAVLQQVLMNSLQTPGIGATTGFSSLRSYVSFNTGILTSPWSTWLLGSHPTHLDVHPGSTTQHVRAHAAGSQPCNIDSVHVHHQQVRSQPLSHPRRFLSHHSTPRLQGATQSPVPHSQQKHKSTGSNSIDKSRGHFAEQHGAWSHFDPVYPLLHSHLRVFSLQRP